MEELKNIPPDREGPINHSNVVLEDVVNSLFLVVDGRRRIAIEEYLVTLQRDLDRFELRGAPGFLKHAVGTLDELTASLEAQIMIVRMFRKRISSLRRLYHQKPWIKEAEQYLQEDD